MNNKKLFKLSVKRQILLGDVISTIGNKIEISEGLGMSILKSVETKEGEEFCRDERDKKEKEIKELKICHDVLETVACHSQEYMLDTFRYDKELTWKNEHDIPSDTFNNAIDTAIKLIQGYIECPICKSNIEKNKKAINFLKELKDFVNNQ